MSKVSPLTASLVGLGAALVTVLAFPSLQAAVHRDALEVRLGASENVDADFFIDGEPATERTALEPGLHYHQWKRLYRGGHVRSVGQSRLRGPFQDVAAPPCSLFFLVDQSFLDDGKASEGTVAYVVKSLIEAEVRGLDVWPLGRFKAVEKLGLSWVRWQQADEEGREGHLKIVLALRFADGRVPLEIKMVPTLIDGELRFRSKVRAKLNLDNRVYQWIANRFDGNDRVSGFLQSQVRHELSQVLSTPPPVPLIDGAELELRFCEGRQIAFHEQGFVALPLAVVIDEGDAPPPLQVDTQAPLRAAMTTPLAIDMDANALNAILHKLWSSRVLDHQLAASLVTAFNEEETVQSFLSLRLAKARFHLPPTLQLGDDSFQVRAAAALEIEDQGKRSQARLFTRLDMDLALLESGEPLAADTDLLRLAQLEMSCLPEPKLLRACYSEVFTQVQANQASLQYSLAESFRTLLRDILVERDIGSPGTPGHFKLQSATFSLQDKVLRTSLKGVVASTLRTSTP